MDRTRVVIGAGLIELEREAVVRIHSARLKQPRIADGRVRLIVHVGPSHRRSGLDRQRRWRKHKVLDHNLCRVSGICGRRVADSKEPHHRGETQ